MEVIGLKLGQENGGNQAKKRDREMEVIRPKIGIGKNHNGMKKCDFWMTEKFKYEANPVQ